MRAQVEAEAYLQKERALCRLNATHAQLIIQDANAANAKTRKDLETIMANKQREQAKMAEKEEHCAKIKAEYVTTQSIVQTSTGVVVLVAAAFYARQLVRRCCFCSFAWQLAKIVRKREHVIMARHGLMFARLVVGRYDAISAEHDEIATAVEEHMKSWVSYERKDVKFRENMKNAKKQVGWLSFCEYTSRHRTTDINDTRMTLVAEAHPALALADVCCRWWYTSLQCRQRKPSVH